MSVLEWYTCRPSIRFVVNISHCYLLLKAS